METMRAVVMRDRKLVVGEVPVPRPGPGEVLVRTLACGICGSDLHALKHAEKFVETERRAGIARVMDLGRDVVMGHEFCAEIVEHGPRTQHTLAVGTRVCSRPTLARESGSESIGYSNDNPGGYGEYMRLSEPLLLEVPNGLPTDHAALTEPMAVGVHAVQKARLAPVDAPLVIGCGPVGLAVIAGLKIKGIHPIIAADFSPMRRALAEALGADIVVDPGAASPYLRWAEAAEPAGYDPLGLPALLGLGPQPRPGVIFECVGVPGMIQQLLEGAPRHARIVIVGVCMERDHVEPFFAIRKQLNVQFVLGYTAEEFALTLRHVAEGAVNAAPMITGSVGLDGVRAAFADLADPVRHAKILVEPWR
jgi:threonine dehydrogenase-like Zn-dependent dehydrogenase